MRPCVIPSAPWWLKILLVKFKEAVPKAEVLEQPQYFGKFQPLKS
jgi:hypothetical protein